MGDPVDISTLSLLRQLQPPGKPDAVARIITRFLAETDERLAGLRAAAESGDSAAVERAAHAMNGISGTVGATEMREVAVRLEQLGRDGRWVDAAAAVVELEAALARARPIFERLRDAT